MLGKLTYDVVIPQFFGAGVVNNFLSVFFRTEQEVGSLANKESGVWIDAPVNYDFKLYCVVQDLADAYYVSEAGVDSTTRLPRASLGEVISCQGRRVPAAAMEEGAAMTELGRYDRAVLSLTGRLIKGTQYGFRIRLDNAPLWEMNSLNAWRIRTYENGNLEEVDATYSFRGL